jgi:hypothetical protein
MFGGAIDGLDSRNHSCYNNHASRPCDTILSLQILATEQNKSTFFSRPRQSLV